MSLLEKSPDKRCHNTTQLRSVLRSLASDTSKARNNLAALEIRKPDVAVSGPLEDNQRLQNETSDSKSAKEVEPASLEIIPTELPAELTGLSRDPFYEDPYALPARPEESESKSVNKSFSSGSAESRSGKSIESVASETTPPQHKPNRVAKRELFEPPTITVMDPPLNASENVNANRSLPQVSSHKVDVQAGLTQEQAGGSKLRLGVLVLLSVATAILLSILLARGNHMSKFLSEAPAAESGEAPSGLSLKPGTSVPAQGEAEKKDSAALEDINLAGSNDDKQTVSQQSPSRNQRWRAQPVVRSQNARAKRLLSRSQAGRLNQRSRQRIRSARWRYLRQLRQR
jgi:hypothetical protein